MKSDSGYLYMNHILQQPYGYPVYKIVPDIYFKKIYTNIYHILTIINWIPPEFLLQLGLKPLLKKWSNISWCCGSEPFWSHLPSSTFSQTLSTWEKILNKDWSHYLLMFKSPAGFFELVLVLRAVALKPTDEARLIDSVNCSKICHQKWFDQLALFFQLLYRSNSKPQMV